MAIAHLILVRSMTRAVPLVIFATLLISCASEQDRYQWNRAHAFVCPKARVLSDGELDQIAHVLAQATPQVAVQIGPPAGADPRRELFVLTAYRGGERSEDRNSYGACTLKKQSNGWRVTYLATDCSPSLWHVMGCL
jgi:hypothetical protein